MIKLNIQRFSSTNKTTHYELSQYVSSDLPTYLVDYNSDMSKIDTAINTAQTTADTASTAATNAQTAAETAQTTATTAVTNAASAQTSANTALSNIGTLANLDTVVKTSTVAAINEVVGNVGNVSSLTTDVKTDVVSAINSIETKIEELDNYSTSETFTGKYYIDSNNVSHKIYRRVFTTVTVDSTGTYDEFQIINDSNIKLVEGEGVIILSGYRIEIGTPDFGFGRISNIMENPTGMIFFQRDKNQFGNLGGVEIMLEYYKVVDNN